MENKSNHSANAPNAKSASEQNVKMTESANDNIGTTPVDNSFSATAALTTNPVQSIDILKEAKEKADITKSSDDRMATVKPSEIPMLSSVITQKQSTVASVDQVEIPPPTPTIVARSIDSGFLKDNTDRLPSVQTVNPQQTLQEQVSAAAQFKAELTVKDSALAAIDGASNVDEAPQELAFHRTSAPNNTSTVHHHHQPLSSAFDGFAGKMNKLRDQMSNIFPIGIMGCRDTVADASGNSGAADGNSSESTSNSRRFMDAKEASQDCVGHIDSTPRKRPSSCKPSTGRNPLTGFGLDDADDMKRGFGRRKDGNPVLGVGYNAGNIEDAGKPTGRIPPGGHSTKLW